MLLDPDRQTKPFESPYEVRREHQKPKEFLKLLMRSGCMEHGEKVLQTLETMLHAKAKS